MGRAYLNLHGLPVVTRCVCQKKKMVGQSRGHLLYGSWSPRDPMGHVRAADHVGLFRYLPYRVVPRRVVLYHSCLARGAKVGGWCSTALGGWSRCNNTPWLQSLQVSRSVRVLGQYCSDVGCVLGGARVSSGSIVHRLCFGVCDALSFVQKHRLCLHWLFGGQFRVFDLQVSWVGMSLLAKVFGARVR
jgi:hypothetical protein